jgi:hypothetical protein
LEGETRGDRPGAGAGRLGGLAEAEAAALAQGVAIVLTQHQAGFVDLLDNGVGKLGDIDDLDLPRGPVVVHLPVEVHILEAPIAPALLMAHRIVELHSDTVEVLDLLITIDCIYRFP